MANVLTTGAWLSAPTEKPSFLSRLFHAYLESRERRATLLVEHYVATRGLKQTDASERQIERLLFKAGR